ncbi:MAG: glycosyltransferase family 4 protein [Burkholderiales bacterium]|nr:glycosyltransferase family 4 protein [Burkholderiales bacterium]
MKTRIALHRFESDGSLPQRDGVNLAHEEINALLGSRFGSDFEVSFHDFDRVVRDDAHALQVLAGADCVLCNVGPHAHYYHSLREKLGLDFRIVRDIRTALWSCYLLQEALCEPYLRPGDALIALSAYSRTLTRRVFPHLHGHPIHLFDPVLAGMQPAAAQPRRNGHDGRVTLGHVGRLSEDKNFPQMVELLIELDREEPGRYRLEACGAVHSPACEPAKVAAELERRTGRSDLFAYLPPVPHGEVLDVFRRFDWFLFFSTSNLETLGRVLLEASHAGVPVLAGDHAAASEIVDASSLLGVTYAREQAFYAHFDAPMGRVDIATAAKRIREGAAPAAPPPPRVNDLQVLGDLLRGEADGSCLRPDELASAPRGFIEALRWADLPRYATTAAADATIAELRDWFCALNGRQSADFGRRLEALMACSRFPGRTQRFIQSAQRTQCDFSNLGGFDMELCNIAGFHPRFWLV